VTLFDDQKFEVMKVLFPHGRDSEEIQARLKQVLFGTDFTTLSSALADLESDIDAQGSREVNDENDNEVWLQREIGRGEKARKTWDNRIEDRQVCPNEAFLGVERRESEDSEDFCDDGEESLNLHRHIDARMIMELHQVRNMPLPQGSTLRESFNRMSELDAHLTMIERQIAQRGSKILADDQKAGSGGNADSNGCKKGGFKESIATKERSIPTVRNAGILNEGREKSFQRLNDITSVNEHASSSSSATRIAEWANSQILPPICSSESSVADRLPVPYVDVSSSKKSKHSHCAGEEVIDWTRVHAGQAFDSNRFGSSCTSPLTGALRVGRSSSSTGSMSSLPTSNGVDLLPLHMQTTLPLPMSAPEAGLSDHIQRLLQLQRLQGLYSNNLYSDSHPIIDTGISSIASMASIASDSSASQISDCIRAVGERDGLGILAGRGGINGSHAYTGDELFSGINASSTSDFLGVAQSRARALLHAEAQTLAKTQQDTQARLNKLIKLGDTLHRKRLTPAHKVTAAELWAAHMGKQGPSQESLLSAEAEKRRQVSTISLSPPSPSKHVSAAQVLQDCVVSARQRWSHVREPVGQEVMRVPGGTKSAKKKHVTMLPSIPTKFLDEIDSYCRGSESIQREADIDNSLSSPSTSSTLTSDTTMGKKRKAQCMNI
jgi:hypothetical protein